MQDSTCSWYLKLCRTARVEFAFAVVVFQSCQLNQLVCKSFSADLSKLSCVQDAGTVEVRALLFLKRECSHRTCYIYIYLRVWIRIIYLMNFMGQFTSGAQFVATMLARENCWKWLWRKRSTEPLDWWICRGGR